MVSSSRIKRLRLAATIFVTVILIFGTIVAIKFAQGYRPNFTKLGVEGTGLLSTTSYPKSAQVYINDRLTTTTDDTLNLVPGQYQIKIVKTGFSTWTKTIPIAEQLVTLTDARLFPSIPSLIPFTFYQVTNPLVSPDGNKIVYVLTGSPFSQDNGLYVLSLGNNLLGNQITQIDDQSRQDYTKAELIWSPDNSQILAIFHDGNKIQSSHLLNARGSNQSRNIIDTTAKLPQILNQYQDQVIKINQSLLSRLPDFMVKIASQSATNVYFSPDHEKMLYTSTSNVSLPENAIGKSLPNINSTKETRDLVTGKTYVFDTKEDTNYLISQAQYDPETAKPFLVSPAQVKPTPTPTPSPKAKKPIAPPADPLLAQITLLKAQTEPRVTQNLSWYPTNRHLVISGKDGVAIIEYDGNNLTAITSAQLSNGFSVASPDGNRLIILSNLNQKPDVFNLFSLDLK